MKTIGLTKEMMKERSSKKSAEKKPAVKKSAEKKPAEATDLVE